MMPACSEMWINTWKYSACNHYVSSNIPQQPFQCPVFTATATVLSCIMQACWKLVAATLHFICNVDHSSSSSFGSASNFSWHTLKNELARQLLSSATAAFPRVRETDSCCISTLKVFVKTCQILVNIMETVAPNIKTQIFYSIGVQFVMEDKSQLFYFIWIKHLFVVATYLNLGTAL